MGKIIAFTGAHGTGKTTAVHDYIAQMKKMGSAYEIGLITETPRRCPLPIFGKESVASVEAQNWIFADQMRCEIDVSINDHPGIRDAFHSFNKKTVSVDYTIARESQSTVSELLVSNFTATNKQRQMFA